MSAAGRMHQIRAGAGQDDPDDLAVMVDALATARRSRHPRTTESEADTFAMAVLCLLFDPVKPPPYRLAIRALRQQYRGIAQSFPLQQQFRDSLTDKLLDAVTFEDVFELDVVQMFAAVRVIVGAS